MKKLIILFCLVNFSLVSFGQVYQEMPQYGYRANRMAFDSTLSIPTTCGVPTLKSNITKKAALAFDSCNNKFYYYNPKTLAWSEITGGGSFDSTSLSNRINTKIDSLKRSSDSVYAYKNGTKYFQFKDSIGGGTFISPNLQQVLDSGNTATDKSITLSNINYSDIYTKIDGIVNPTGEGKNKAFEYNVGTPTDSYYGNVSMGIDYSSGDTKPYIEGLAATNKYPFRLIADSLIFGNNVYSSNYLKLSNSNQVMLQLPQSTSEHYLATSVNNNYADANGDITISSGTVTSVATGYGLSGGPITTSGTLSVDTSVLNDLYAQNGRFGNDTATILMAKIHNNSGATLTNGKVVFLASSGTNADVPSVRLANSKNDSTSANTFGFVTGSIANNDTGWIILSGKIEKLNTAAYANGDIIYLDTISGNWTKNKPVAPVHLVYLGVVIKANAGNGSIFVKCQNGYELDEIHDVLITNKLNNQVLAYSDTQKVWKNRNIYSIVDTTTFQRKSISSYSIMANNTPSAANTTAQVFNDSSVKSYPSANITWTGGTAPTTLTTSTYTFTQVGKMVFLYIYLVYTNAASTPTSLTLQIPSDVPQPSNLGTTPAAGNYTFISGLTFGRATITTQATTFGNTSFMRRNAGNTAYEMVTFSTNGAFRVISHSYNYKTD